MASIGWAVAAHGHPRYTKDLDVWVWPDHANAAAVVRALVDFGFGSAGIEPADFTKLESVVQLGVPPNRVDLLTSPDGVVFSECWPNRVTLDLAGLEVPFMGLDDLLSNKRAANRPQDVADVAALEGDGTE